jgi:acetylornithine deacetylase
MRDFERRRNEAVDDPLFAAYDIPFALCIGSLRSGIWASTVAETLTGEGRLGVSPHEDPETVRRDFEEVIQAAADADPWLRDRPPTVEWWGAQFDPASTDPAHPLVQTLAGAHQAVSGADTVLRGMPYGADMRLLVHVGDTPTVLYGPGDVRRAHAPNEFVPINELVTATKALILTILRFFGASQNSGTG